MDAFLLDWPRVGLPLTLLVDALGSTMTTSRVTRVLQTTDRTVVVETRNSVYRIECASGSEAEWSRLCGLVPDPTESSPPPEITKVIEVRTDAE
jgi:hypothetical protein